MQWISIFLLSSYKLILSIETVWFYELPLIIENEISKHTYTYVSMKLHSGEFTWKERQRRFYHQNFKKSYNNITYS